MQYNIDYEIMGMLVTLVIAIAFKMNYVSRTRSDKAFMVLVYFILGSQALDMITAYTFSMMDPALNTFNLIMNTAYFYCAFATAVAFERYISSYIRKPNNSRLYDCTRYAIVILYCIHGVLNPFTGLAFYFLPDGTYVHGDLYYIGYIAPGIFELASFYQIIRYRRHFSKKQWISSVAFLGVVAIAMILQATVCKDVYLTFGLIPVALLMILFSLETPDYRRLTHTLSELEKARQEAWHANHVKSDFLANMSHEIRTPINAILGFDEMILRESDDEEVLSYAGNIKNSGQTLLTLVNDILDLSKIEAGKMEIINADYDTVQRLSDTLKMIAPRAEEKGLKLTFDIDEKIPRKLYGDDIRIAQVLTNLLTNAVKYTKEGEVILQIRLKETDADGVTLFFAVKDTGIGIREEDQGKMFSEFSRLDGTKTHGIEGTGLGLPITMRCLLLMGSRLEVDSVYGKGSTFSFELRQKVADPSPIGDVNRKWRENVAEVAVFKEDFTAPDARILVVDDVELNLKVFKGLLKKSLLKIDTAAGGAQAIEMIRENPYDCIFMDHQMPGMDGIEALERLKADPDIRIEDTPVIALTANAIAGAREMYLKKGFADYLTKPIDGWQLLGMLHKWLPAAKLHEISGNGEDVQEKPGSDGIIEFLPKEAAADDTKPPATVMERLKALGIDVDAGLRYTMSDEKFYVEILGDYVSNADSIIEELNGYLLNKDWDNYRIRIHSLKSSSKMIGAMKLSGEAMTLEYAARDREISVIESRHEGFIIHYTGLKNEIGSIIADGNS